MRIIKERVITIKEVRQLYKQLKPKIVKRLNKFKDLWKTKDDAQLFGELCFCLLTPQSKAKTCWAAILKLKEKGLLFSSDIKQVQEFLTGVRFRNKKAKYIVRARELFQEIRKALKRYKGDELRLWLIRNICGLGYKEASHFLRNIGLGERFAILDRHVLKNLKLLGIIKKVPKSLTNRHYIKIENKLKPFSKRMSIPISHLDLLFWSKETGEIFK